MSDRRDRSDTAYFGLMASTWDLFRQGQENWDDRFFFQDVIRKYGEPVLDVGCATGRLILQYLKQGIDVDGGTVPLRCWLCVGPRQRAKASSRRFFSNGWRSLISTGSTGPSSCLPVPCSC